MFIPVYTNQFSRDTRRLLRMGTDINKLKKVMIMLINGEKLHPDYWDHILPGRYKRHREVHIEIGLLLLYKVEGTQIIFERAGNDADLFGLFI